jgi:membrane protease YdiL (CAAX protease family)
MSDTRASLQRAITWGLGRLEHRAPEPDSAWLLSWACIVGGLAMYVGDAFNVLADEVTRGAFRAQVHGILPLAGLTAGIAWFRGRGRGWATIALLVSTYPALWRVAGPTGRRMLRSEPELFWASVVIGVICILAATRAHRLPLSTWGIGLGDWRWWGPRTALAAAVMIPVLTAAVFLSDGLADTYPLARSARKDWGSFAWAHLGVMVDFMGWELLFRGVLLFATYRRGDPWPAVWLQAIPFFLLHAHKPPVELVASLLGAPVAAWFTLRARSVIPLIFLHTLQMTTVGFVAQCLRLAA